MSRTRQPSLSVFWVADKHWRHGHDGQEGSEGAFASGDRGVFLVDAGKWLASCGEPGGALRQELTSACALCRKVSRRAMASAIMVWIQSLVGYLVVSLAGISLTFPNSISASRTPPFRPLLAFQCIQNTGNMILKQKKGQFRNVEGTFNFRLLWIDLGKQSSLSSKRIMIVFQLLALGRCWGSWPWINSE